LLFQVLTAAGHAVLEAANGEEALALGERRSQPIDLLLTDVVMPGMSGPDLVGRLRSVRPNLPVLYMSGYDRDLIDQKTLETAAGFLPKPFSPRALLEGVDQLLGVAGTVSPSGYGRGKTEEGRQCNRGSATR
jgi:two-component system cell cycle sensor histidine kinase/response regulator CckA